MRFSSHFCCVNGIEIESQLKFSHLADWLNDDNIIAILLKCVRSCNSFHALFFGLLEMGFGIWIIANAAAATAVFVVVNEIMRDAATQLKTAHLNTDTNARVQCVSVCVYVM